MYVYIMVFNRLIKIFRNSYNITRIEFRVRTPRIYTRGLPRRLLGVAEFLKLRILFRFVKFKCWAKNRS